MQIDPLGTPMMSKAEITYIRNLINDNKYETCLEWGSGNSTAYFPKNCKSIKQWVSIEHEGNYVAYLRDKIDPTKVVHIWIPEDNWYVDCVKHNGKKYDFILIDGSMRGKCLETAFSLVVPRTGVILLHDAGREEYHDFIKKYPHEVVLKGERERANGFFVHRGITLFRA